MEKWVSRLIMVAGLSMVAVGILAYMYYAIYRFEDRLGQFATYPYRQYSASLLSGGFALLATGFGLLWHTNAGAETTLSRHSKIGLFISLVFFFPLFVLIGSFIHFDAGPTSVTDEEQLQTFFTAIVISPVMLIAVLIALDRLANRLAH